MPALIRRRALHEPLSPNITVALPVRLSVCWKLTYPYQPLVGLPTYIVPFRTNPSYTLRYAPLTLSPTSSVPLMVTASRVPELLDAIKEAPFLVTIVPPSTVPPTKNHELPAPSSVSVALVLFKVPVRLTVPLARLRVPKLAVVKLPPRFTVVLLTLMLEELVQLPLSVRVELTRVSGAVML